MAKTVTRTVKFQQTLTPGQTIMLEDDSPVWGNITAIMVHFPTNCNAKVDVAVGHEYSRNWLLPSLMDTYIALDDTTQSWYFVGEGVEKGESIWTRMRNRGLNPHTISVVVTVEGTEESK